MEKTVTELGEWLEERCREERLSLRDAAGRTGLSHAAIRNIANGNRPSPESIRKLAHAFAPDGALARIALEDQLLVLAGYRTARPYEELTEPMARVVDKLRRFNENQLKVVGQFAEFLSKIKT